MLSKVHSGSPTFLIEITDLAVFDLAKACKMTLLQFLVTASLEFLSFSPNRSPKFMMSCGPRISIKFSAPLDNTIPLPLDLVTIFIPFARTLCLSAGLRMAEAYDSSMKIPLSTAAPREVNLVLNSNLESKPD